MDTRTLVNGFLLECKVVGRSPRAVEFYEEKLSKFVWFVEAYKFPSDVREIGTQHVKSFLGYLRDTDKHRYGSDTPMANKPLSFNTVKKFYVVLRAMFNWAAVEGIIETSPLATIKPPKEQRQTVKGLTAEQVQRLLSVLNGRDFEYLFGTKPLSLC